jgi:hypothetical protein
VPSPILQPNIENADAKRTDQQLFDDGDFEGNYAMFASGPDIEVEEPLNYQHAREPSRSKQQANKGSHLERIQKIWRKRAGF